MAAIISSLAKTPQQSRHPLQVVEMGLLLTKKAPTENDSLTVRRTTLFGEQIVSGGLGTTLVQRFARMWPPLQVFHCQHPMLERRPFVQTPPEGSHSNSELYQRVT